MAIDSRADTSFYRYQQPEFQDPLDAQRKAQDLKSLALQQEQMGLQNEALKKQIGAKDYDQQTKALDFHINQAGAIAQLAMGAKDQQSYENALAQAEKLGMDTSGVPKQYDPGIVKSLAANALKQSDRLAAMKQQYELPNIQSQTVKNYAEAGKSNAEKEFIPQKMQADLNNSMYGARSPNAEITSQYDKQMEPIRKSQIAMAQMHDNYNNPSPQGDASLILNAFRIKFPNAPDVNSLKELSESQAASDHWKQMAAGALEGGLDQATRDNLMRDGISTYRANYETGKGIQERYAGRAKAQNINDPSLLAEPALDKTYKDVMGVQEKIGPYVPPTERPGIMSGLAKKASNILGINSASASKDAPAPIGVPDGSIVMKFPDGKLKVVPKTEKGKWIAAGGDVVK